MAHQIPNFNIYEVLEPVKSTSSNEIGILVDISNESDSICKHLRGSDLDNVKKSEFDLVDLYQNIYVTPQHVSKPTEKDSLIDNNGFFEKIELEGRINNQSILKDRLSEEDINEFLTRSDTVNKEKVNPGKSSEKCIFSQNLDITQKTDWILKNAPFTNTDIKEEFKSPEELDQESTDKTNEKSMLNHNIEIWEKIDFIIKNGLEGIPLKGADVNELSSRCYRVDKEAPEKCNEKPISYQNEERGDKTVWNEHFSQIKSDLSNGNNDLNVTSHGVNWEDPGKSNLQSLFNHHILCNNGIKVLKPPKLEELSGKVLNNENHRKTIKDLNAHRVSVDSSPVTKPVKCQNAQTEKLNSRYSQPRADNIELLQTAKLDKKTYAKHRLVKSENEKLGYVKGPDLYEKSVVLPQIMNRLAARKQALEEEAKHEKILILDSGERSPECVCQCTQSPGAASKEALILKERESANNKTSAHILNHSNSSLNNMSQSDRGEHVSNGPKVTLNPVVAMENCNRERLLANRVRSAFEHFVKTGSYY